MSNPFNPAPGATPARIIGREAELAAIREASRRAEISGPYNSPVDAGIQWPCMLMPLASLIGDLQKLIPHWACDASPT